MLKLKNNKLNIKAYGINHAMQLIIGFRSYQAASLAIDKGLLDWAGDRDAYHNLDKEDIKDYLTIYSFQN